MLDVNLTAVFELCQLAAKQFMAQESKGKIITVASMLSFFGGYTVPAYAASKGGVAQITKAFCNEWAEKGINVNSIAPGYMATGSKQSEKRSHHKPHSCKALGNSGRYERSLCIPGIGCI